MFAMVMVTCPDQATARKLAGALLKKRLVACASIVPSVESRYWWKGTIESGSETLMFLKTRVRLFKKLEEEVRRHHPYEVPELIMFNIKAGSGHYLEWLAGETKR